MSIVTSIKETVELSVINCGECGGTYAINDRYRKQKAQQGGGWNCPYCKCNWGYWSDNDTEIGRLKNQLKSAEKRVEWAENGRRKAQQRAERTERRRRAEKAAKTRIKNRVAKGVCPCCNRHFENLHRHMQTKHPDYTEQA